MDKLTNLETVGNKGDPSGLTTTPCGNKYEIIVLKTYISLDRGGLEFRKEGKGVVGWCNGRLNFSTDKKNRGFTYGLIRHGLRRMYGGFRKNRSGQRTRSKRT